MSDVQEVTPQTTRSDTDITNQMSRLNTNGSTSSFQSMHSNASTMKEQREPMITLPESTFNRIMKVVEKAETNNGDNPRKRQRVSNEDDGPNNKKRGKPNINEDNLSEYRQARNLKAKLQKYIVTNTTLEKYIGHDEKIVPKSFEIKIKPMIGNDNKTFIEKWDSEILKMQRNLLDLQTEFCRSMVHELTRDSTNATTALREKLSNNQAELNEAEAAIETVAKRVKATEYTKLQGRWARDIGDHESQAMGIPTKAPNNNNKKSNGRPNQKPKNQRNNDKKENNFQNRKFKTAKRRLNNNNKNRNQNKDDINPKDIKKIMKVLRAMEED